MKLNKNFEELDDKLIIQYFYRIYICIFIYTINSSNFSTLKNI